MIGSDHSNRFCQMYITLAVQFPFLKGQGTKSRRSRITFESVIH